MTSAGAVAVLPVRNGTLPSGSLDAVAAAAGEVLVVGEDARAAAGLLGSLATRIRL